MSYSLPAMILMKIKEKGVGCEVNRKWYVAIVAY